MMSPSAPAADLAVNEPVLRVAAAARLDDHRPVFLIGLLDIVPSALTFDHMGVGIDGWHKNYLPPLLPASSAPLAPLSIRGADYLT